MFKDVSMNYSLDLFCLLCVVRKSVFIIVLFVETPRKFITAKLSIRKPGSSSMFYRHANIQRT
jgi:hypothetical protein